MTENELEQIIGNGIHEFHLYNYEEPIIGILDEEPLNSGKYFIVPNMIEYNAFRAGTKKMQEVGIPVTLGGIVSRRDFVNRANQNLSFSFNEEFKATKLVIIGAGASHGFATNLTGLERPPLANHLLGNNYE